MILGSGNENSLEEKLIAMVGPPSEEKLRGRSFFFLTESFIKEEIFMMDFVFVGLTIFFGLISWAFIVLCSKV